MRAELRHLHSPDADPLNAYKPTGEFGVLVMALVGPDEGPGEEAFSFVLCTPEWFAEHQMSRPPVSGRHTVFVRQFDYVTLESYVRDYCFKCKGASWPEVAEKLARLGEWEFEDYDVPPIRP